MGIFQNNLMGAAAAAASGGAGGGIYDYQVAKSARFQLANSSYMYRTPSSAGNRRTWTYSTWVKRTKYAINTSFFGATRSGYENVFRFEDTSGKDQINLFGFTGSGLDFNIQTKGSFRDSSAWYHIVIAMDTTQGTSTNRLKLYLNGVQQTELKENTYPSQNYDTNVNDTSTQTQVGYGSYGGQYFDGYIADSILIDGTQYAASDFGEFKNGVWIPKDPSGLTFGTNGFHINYASSSDLGNDVSGNNNDLTVSGIEAHDSMIDSPTFNSDSTGGNFATYNPLNKGTSNSLSEGNLQTSGSAGGNVSGTMAFLTGKWYWEQRAETVSAYGPTFGIGQLGSTGSATVAGGEYNIITWQTQAGQIYGGGGYPEGMGTITVTQTGVTSLSSGDVMGFWLDLDNNKLWITKNGAFLNSGNPATGSNPQASWASTGTQPMTFTTQNVASGVGILNAGQNPSFNGTQTAGSATDKNGFGLFKYDPSGTDFIAMCSGNLPVADAIDPAQTDDYYPSKVFSAIPYTGTGSEKAVAVGWQPDFVWVKERGGDNDHKLTDSVRGATKFLESNTNDVEGTDAQGVKAFTSTGFTLGTDAVYNNQNDTYLSWNWKEGADYGLDIATYTGTLTGSGVVNISHSLGAIPECLWTMCRSGAALGGGIRHKNLTNANYIMTNANSGGASSGWGQGAQINKSNNGNMTALGTSSTFTTNYTSLLNENNYTYVTYVWKGIEGFSSFGTYKGNGNADGTFVYTGFSPAYIIIKRRDAVESYMAVDNKRDPYNIVESVFQLNGDGGEYTTDYDVCDFLSNGFKIRNYDTPMNQATTYVYLAFAENPFKYATAR